MTAANEIVTHDGGTLRTYRVGYQWSCGACRYKTTMLAKIASAHRRAALHLARKHDKESAS